MMSSPRPVDEWAISGHDVGEGGGVGGWGSARCADEDVADGKQEVVPIGVNGEGRGKGWPWQTSAWGSSKAGRGACRSGLS